MPPEHSVVPASDASLIRSYLAGDRHALDQLLRRYEEPLYLFLLGLLRDRDSAQDALQETFVAALEQVHRVDPDHFRGWAFTVAFHQAMLARRRGKIEARALHAFAGHLAGQAATAPDPAHLVESAEMQALCRHQIALLPETERRAVCLRYFEGLKFREIARKLGCPLGTALARLHSGLKRLRSSRGWSHE
ncbi:MAG: hypothetical protein C4297_00285 [Gemmataceae bacterium]